MSCRPADTPDFGCKKEPVLIPLSRIVLYIAPSPDGFIAGPSDALDWLFDEGPEDYGYADFFAAVGALVMGRRAHDVIRAFGA